jgi:agmatinase
LRPLNFLGLDETGLDSNSADVFIQPIPYDATTSFQPGTRFGPEAILQASQQVELWDEELGWEPFGRYTCLTLKDITANQRGPEFMAGDIRERMKPFHRAGKLVAALGGEHSLSFPIVQSLQEEYPDLVICSLDAHGDLREEWEGSRFSHACVLRRISELNLPIFHLGLRSLSREEAEYLRDQPLIRTYSSREILLQGGLKRLARDLAESGAANIYLTLDMDVFDPGLVPGTGTPEPGGLSWFTLLEAVQIINGQGKIRGLDITELMPIQGSKQSEFIAAKLLFKIFSYLLHKKGAAI